MLKILITGHKGYFASSLYTHLKDIYDVTVVGRDELDLTDSFKVNEWFIGKHFDVVIHTAITGGHRLIPDNASVMDANLRMYYNLLDNRKSYTRFLNIGSGAELHRLDTPYGLSKSIIAKSILEHDNFYNIRAYAVFDENELPTRFIKMSITNYIKKEPIVITLDKHMDFFYMKDFVRLIKYYITAESPDKLTDCAYSTSPSLKTIANKINSLSNYHEVEIQFVADGLATHYCAPFPRKNLPIELCGWEKGIELTYEALCNR
jgi:nucleoside-diphosphate-sugar epimerase